MEEELPDRSAPAAETNPFGGGVGTGLPVESPLPTTAGSVLGQSNSSNAYLSQGRQALGGTGEEGGQFDVTKRTTQVDIPGYGPTSISTLLYEPYRVLKVAGGRAKILAFQRNLVAAGYLSGKIRNPGWYGEETISAYANLIEESIRAQMQPADLLRARAMSSQGKDPGVLEGGDQPEDAWRKELEASYVEAWDRRPPPGYLDNFKNLNADEFTFLEKQKEAWAGSKASQEQQGQLLRELAEYMAGRNG